MSLDYLRAVAVLLVLMMHVESNPVFIQMGWVGVDLFFVLSGFLVSVMLMKEYIKNGFIRIRHFLIRRGFKIYPMFYVLLIVHVVYYYLKGRPPAVPQILAELFFLQNYFPGILGVSWSLAIEEHFYFSIAVIILVVRFWKFSDARKMIPYAAVLVLLMCLCLRGFVWSKSGYGGMYVNYTPTHLRIDSIAVGVLGAYFYAFYPKRFFTFYKKNYFWVLPLSACMILPVFFFGRNSMFVNTIGYSLIALGFGMIIAVAVCFSDRFEFKQTNFIQISLTRVMLSIGTSSYAIYLSHFLFGAIIVNQLRLTGFILLSHLVLVVIYLIFCVVLGIVLTHAIEKPFLRIRDRYFPSL